jgi:putative membrane protein
MSKKLAAFSIFTFVLIFEPLYAIAQQTTPQQQAPEYYGPGPWHMWGYGYGWHFWWMFPMMMIFFLLTCAIVFAFGYRMCGRGWHRSGPPSHFGPPWSDPTHSALQILNERFARGEVQKDEYSEKKAAILSGTRT